MCRFAKAAGARATTKRGAIPALPTRAEVMDLIKADTASKPMRWRDGTDYHNP